MCDTVCEITGQRKRQGTKKMARFLKVTSVCYWAAGHPEPGRPRSSGEGLERSVPSGGQAEAVLRVLPPTG